MTLRVACVQMRHDGELKANLERAREMIAEAADQADLALLPEYFFGPIDADPDPDEGSQQVRDFFVEASSENDVTVAGNTVEPRGENLANVGLVYVDGQPVLEQPKIYPMENERDRGIEPGDTVDVADAEGWTVGLVVCADILFPEVAVALADAGAEILLNPVMSPYRADDPTRNAREAMYVARAYDSAAFVAKSGGIHGDTHVGRSLVAAPWGVIARYDDERGEEILVAELDKADLDRVRGDRERFPKRRGVELRRG